jgi:hypothetical protein
MQMRGKFKQLPNNNNQKSNRERKRKKKIQNKKVRKTKNMDRCPSVVLVPIHHSASIKKNRSEENENEKKRKIKGEKPNSQLSDMALLLQLSQSTKGAHAISNGRKNNKSLTKMDVSTHDNAKKRKKKKNLPLGNCLFQINNFCISSSSPCTPYQLFLTLGSHPSCVLSCQFPFVSAQFSCPPKHNGPTPSIKSNPTQPPKKNLKKKKKLKKKPQGPSNKSRASRQITENNVNYDIAPSLKIQLEKKIIKISIGDNTTRQVQKRDAQSHYVAPVVLHSTFINQCAVLLPFEYTQPSSQPSAAV